MQITMDLHEEFWGSATLRENTVCFRMHSSVALEDQNFEAAMKLCTLTVVAVLLLVF